MEAVGGVASDALRRKSAARRRAVKAKIKQLEAGLPRKTLANGRPFESSDRPVL